MTDIESELRARIEAFVQELSAIVRQEALGAVRDVLTRGGVSLPENKASGAPRLGASHPSARGRHGEKRSPEALLQLTDQLLGYIKGNSGQGMESIAKALNTTTKELTLPVRRLLLDKKIVAKGQKRGTRYFPR
jgi:hypothetical protein